MSFLLKLLIPVVFLGSLHAAEEDSILTRMRALHQERKWKELIAEFGPLDFAVWPAPQAIEALQLRGQIYSFTKDGKRAETDLRAALKLRPQNEVAWLTLADNYTNVLQDDAQALAAYREVLALTGPKNGWQPLTATLGIVRILTDQVRPDEALQTLEPYGDLSGLPPIWRIKMLRAYGHIYAAQGHEAESLAKFREALTLEPIKP